MLYFNEIESLSLARISNRWGGKVLVIPALPPTPFVFSGKGIPRQSECISPFTVQIVF